MLFLRSMTLSVKKHGFSIKANKKTKHKKKIKRLEKQHKHLLWITVEKADLTKI